MKKLKMNIGCLLLTVGFLWISLNSYSQEININRKERKEARKAELAANFDVLNTLFETKSFVLEAYYLENQYGDRIPVSPIINFIKVNASNGVLQTGSNFRIGYNGLGGVTAEGTIGTWKIFRNYKNLSYTLQFSLHTNMGSYDVLMTVNADNNARAVVSGLRPGRLIYNGHLDTIHNSKVYKGQNTI